MTVAQQYDQDFVVPFRHRLRFTRDVLAPSGGEADVLLDLLEPTDRRVRVMFVVDAGVAKGSANLVENLENFPERHQDRISQVGPIVHIAGGEACKNDSRVVDDLLARFNDNDLDRRSYVVVVGGGAVLDAVGFAVAVAHRGLRLIRLPSSTMGQADSGIGVKNAVNLFGKKNWMGTFAVPWAVINDAALLEPLPDRDYRCGFSEAVKVSLLKDAEWFGTLCNEAPLISERNLEAGRRAIERSAYWHLTHITRGGDPFEMLEARPLDFGHWLAHRIEAMTSFTLRHGEAVAIGLAVDCRYSTLRQGLASDSFERIVGCLRNLKLPLFDPILTQSDSILRGLEEFRQHLGGRLTITMLRAPGEPVDVHEIDYAAMHEAIDYVHDRFANGS